jgi:hypothetical protein
MCAGFVAIVLSGCVPDGTTVLGCDGAVHPDGTAAIANYTGQGDSGQGWAGNADGEGGPSAIPPLASDLSPRGGRLCGAKSWPTATPAIVINSGKAH